MQTWIACVAGSFEFLAAAAQTCFFFVLEKVDEKSDKQGFLSSDILKVP